MRRAARAVLAALAAAAMVGCSLPVERGVRVPETSTGGDQLLGAEGQGGIVPLTIRQQLTSETIIGLQNVAGVLALGMVVVMAVVMSAYALLQRRAARWQR